MAQSKVSSYKSHPEQHQPLSLVIMFPHLNQGLLDIKVSSWNDVLIHFVSHGLSNIDLMSRLGVGWRPMKNKPPLFRTSYREGYFQVNAKLYIFEFTTGRQVQTCLDQLVDQLELSHDCYEVTLVSKQKQKKVPKISIYRFKGVNGW